MVLIKERAWNNWNNDGAELLLQMKRSQEEHSCSTRRLRSFGPEQKDKSAGSRRLSENRCLLRKSGFWPIFAIKFVQYSKYSPHLIEKMVSKPLSLATASILGQPPSYFMHVPKGEVVKKVTKVNFH